MPVEGAALDWYDKVRVRELEATSSCFGFLGLPVGTFSLFVVVGSLQSYPIPKREPFLFLGYWASWIFGFPKDPQYFHGLGKYPSYIIQHLLRTIIYMVIGLRV